MNKNVLISQDFFKQQQALDLNDLKGMKLDLQREIYHLDEEVKEENQEKSQLVAVVEKELEELALEFAA